MFLHASSGIRNCLEFSGLPQIVKQAADPGLRTLYASLTCFSGCQAIMRDKFAMYDSNMQSWNGRHMLSARHPTTSFLHWPCSSMILLRSRNFRSVWSVQSVSQSTTHLFPSRSVNPFDANFYLTFPTIAFEKSLDTRTPPSFRRNACAIVSVCVPVPHATSRTILQLRAFVISKQVVVDCIANLSFFSYQSDMLSHLSLENFLCSSSSEGPGLAVNFESPSYFASAGLQAIKVSSCEIKT